MPRRPDLCIHYLPAPYLPARLPACLHVDLPAALPAPLPPPPPPVFVCPVSSNRCRLGTGTPASVWRASTCPYCVRALHPPEEPPKTLISLLTSLFHSISVTLEYAMSVVLVMYVFEVQPVLIWRLDALMSDMSECIASICVFPHLRLFLFVFLSNPFSSMNWVPHPPCLIRLCQLSAPPKMPVFMLVSHVSQSVGYRTSQECSSGCAVSSLSHRWQWYCKEMLFMISGGWQPSLLRK